MLAKPYKTHRAVVLLARAGFGEDAHALARSLFELAFYAKVVAADKSGEMAEHWIDFSTAESYELLRMAKLVDSRRSMRCTRPSDSVAKAEHRASLT